MIKIDFHIHTIKNEFLDNDFLYDSTLLKEYVNNNKIDVIAITNHNFFGLDNYNQIISDLKETNCRVLPGIEISLEKGHILAIGDNNDDYILKLCNITKQIRQEEHDDKYKMTLEQFNEIVCGNDFLLIPHYDKKPAIDEDLISKVKDSIYCGEVKSRKSFVNKIGNGNYTPVLFSDIRIGLSQSIEDYREKNRFTFLDSDKTDFESLKSTLKNKDFVCLSKSGGHTYFDLLNSTVRCSTGINVLLGKRSTGKTFLLDSIYKADKANSLYIKQFEISAESEKVEFHEKIKASCQDIVFDYFDSLYTVFDYIDNFVDNAQSMDVGKYIETLKEYSENAYNDLYSKTNLFNYQKISSIDCCEIENIIKSIETLIDASEEYQAVIKQYLNIKDLIHLRKELLNAKKKKVLMNSLIEKCNNITEEISSKLSVKSTVLNIADADFNDFVKKKYIERKFNNLIGHFQYRDIKKEEIIQTFYKVVSLTKPTNKNTQKSILGVPKECSIDYLYNENHFDAYLQAKKDSNIKNAKDRFRIRLFFDYNVIVTDEYNNKISGGQKSEYLLLEKLKYYKDYEMVLIDEMESSFDNPFLNERIVQQIKEISKNATVFISTHNNNIGVSLRPDYYVYHKKDIVNNEVKYLRYYGRSVDKVLTCSGGDNIKISDVLIETMEASEKAYEERRKLYEDS
ncbi:MAG: hypothetical protein J5691_05705 [Bacilli bacterium]|nr:hypothetical protein [Bacilli bacterium]